MPQFDLSPNGIALPLAAAALALSIWAERIHARRIRAVSRLAFGPDGAPRRWTRLVPPLRVLAATALAWGLTILAVSPGQALDATDEEAAEVRPEDLQRVILLLDVSPSMAIVDAGERRDLERRQRLLQVVEGIFPRIALARTRFSVIAFFTSARPVVVDASDTNVVRNVLDNLPLVWAFEPGKTDVIRGLEAAADLARNWPPESTTLVLCTDGDTVDFDRIPKLPSSIRRVQILAVGDPVVGTFIDGHDSRQQSGVLRRLAAELHGAYHDVNVRHVPSAALAELATAAPRPAKIGLTPKDLALMAVALGAAVLAAVPLALEYAGAEWHAERELPSRRLDDAAETGSAAPVAARAGRATGPEVVA